MGFSPNSPMVGYLFKTLSQNEMSRCQGEQQFKEQQILRFSCHAHLLTDVCIQEVNWLDDSKVPD